MPQCWRWETVQRGRKREHYQWNMDIIGEKSVAAEVELLAAIVDFFRAIGIQSTDVGVKINSRRVLSAILTKFGIGDDQFAEVCVIVDKLDKIGDCAVIEKLVAVNVPEGAAKQIVASLSLKSVEELKALVGEEGKAAVQELEEVFAMAEAYGFADWLYFDASVVRGLAYYTGIVFEGFDRKVCDSLASSSIPGLPWPFLTAWRVEWCRASYALYVAAGGMTSCSLSTDPRRQCRRAASASATASSWSCCASAQPTGAARA